MATKGMLGYGRKGAVRDRDQTYNPKTGLWSKRDGSGKFMSTKKDGTPYKGVRKHK